MRNCPHCYRIGDAPHDPWCPKAKEDDDDGIPAVRPPPAKPDPGGAEAEVPIPMDALTGRLNEVRELIAAQPTENWTLMAERDHLEQLLEKKNG